MSEPIEPSAVETPKDAKARAKAEKAYRKASRPALKKKRTWVLGGIGLIVLISILSSLGGGSGDDKVQAASDDTTPSASASSSKAPPTATPTATPSASSLKATEPAKATKAPKAKPGIGAAVRDGKFEFTVNGIDCSKTQIGDNPYLEKKAQGKFCIADIKVANIGDEAQTFFGSNTKLMNASGQEFSADDSASMYLGDEGNSLMEQINPGNSVEGKVVFDVPSDMDPVSMELHDSAFSGGKTVSLK